MGIRVTQTQMGEGVTATLYHLAITISQIPSFVICYILASYDPKHFHYFEFCGYKVYRSMYYVVFGASIEFLLNAFLQPPSFFLS